MLVFNEIFELKSAGIPFVLCIVTDTDGSTPRKAGSKMLVKSDGTISGTIGGGNIEKHVIEDALVLFRTEKPILKTYHLAGDLQMQCGGKMTLYLEPVFPSEQLILFGGGHIAKALAPMAAMAGFRVAVTDDREGIFDSWPAGPFEKRSISPKEAVNTIAFNDNCYIVVCTHLHTLDCEITAACAAKPHRYLGMIGSSRKVATAKQRLEEEFKLDSETIGSIDMPIGIPIACESPADIAVSILARLIDIKNSAKK